MKFSKEDILYLTAMQLNPKLIPKFYHGESPRDVFSTFDIEDLLELTEHSEREEDAQIEVHTMLIAEPGKTISGADIAKILEKRKKTGATFAQLSSEIPDVTRRVTVSPSPNVVEQRVRTGRGSKR